MLENAIRLAAEIAELRTERARLSQKIDNLQDDLSFQKTRYVELDRILESKIYALQKNYLKEEN